jgi:hypothetical protein
VSGVPHYDYDTNNNERMHLAGNSIIKQQQQQQQQQQPSLSASLNSNTISIRENDELVISCSVNSSKPAANMTMWVLKRPISNYHQLSRRFVLNNNDLDPNSIDNNNLDSPHQAASYLDDDVRRLEISDRSVNQNRDFTLKTSVTTKFVVNRLDNHKLVACLAENNVLNDKWETKRTLNVLCKYLKALKKIN